MSGASAMARELLSLEGKVALVAGAAGGIGDATARLLGSMGAEVIGIDMPGKTAPGPARFIHCDLSEPESIPDLARELGRLDLLVHCAGIRRDAVLWKMEDESWSAVLRANLDSAFYLLKRATPLLRKQGGAAVFVASINGSRGKFGQSNYSASKAGMVGLARTAARELGKFDVRVNIVEPGLIRTPMTEGLPEEAIRQGVDESLLGRMGEPRDVAAAILFLCSSMGRHITGQIVRVDGGQLVA
jgi:3-oxoacyl-[acyl-carrier protein] reductase